MFFICGIYDKDSSYHLDKVRASSKYFGYRVNSGNLLCDLQSLSSMLVCVYDTTDKSKEWYSVSDLFNIIDKTGVEINGLSVSYFRDYIINRTARLVNLPSIDFLLIENTYSAGDIEASLKEVVRNKLFGVRIENGVLYNINNTLIRNEDTLLIPSIVTEFSSRTSNDGVDLSKINKIVLPAGFKFSPEYNMRLLNNALSGVSKNCIVVFDGSLNVAMRFVDSFRYTDFKGIYVTGNINVNVRSIEKYFKEKRYERYYNWARRYFIASSKYIYTLDFSEGTITRRLNDGEITYHQPK